MKNLSFEALPFSQHIFQQSDSKVGKVGGFDVFGSQELVPPQKTEKRLRDLFTEKVESKEAKNPFLQACRENVSRNIQRPVVKVMRESL
jgi:hypothetical protein